jgi:hypothetical protein
MQGMTPADLACVALRYSAPWIGELELQREGKLIGGKGGRSQVQKQLSRAQYSMCKHPGAEGRTEGSQHAWWHWRIRPGKPCKT